jgi:transposase
MPPRKRRSYTAEYKVEAAHRVIDSGRTISEVARELGIDPGMLSVWVKDERRRITAAEVHGDTPLEAADRPSCNGYAGRSANWRRTTLFC